MKHTTGFSTELYTMRFSSKAIGMLWFIRVLWTLVSVYFFIEILQKGRLMGSAGLTLCIGMFLLALFGVFVSYFKYPWCMRAVASLTVVLPLFFAICWGFFFNRPLVEHMLSTSLFCFPFALLAYLIWRDRHVREYYQAGKGS